MPSLRFTLVQIGIGALDLTLITLAMYVGAAAGILPVGFMTMMVPFLTATLLGTVSHAPGGLGVIEVTMLLGLPQFQREELLAALLTFRALYFVLPLLWPHFHSVCGNFICWRRPASRPRVITVRNARPHPCKADTPTLRFSPRKWGWL